MRTRRPSPTVELLACLCATPDEQPGAVRRHVDAPLHMIPGVLRDDDERHPASALGGGQPELP